MAGIGTIYSRDHRRLVQILRELREEAGLRQVDVAQRLRRPQSFVSKYESGQRRLDLVELREVCQVLGISLSQLVERFEKDAPPKHQSGRPRRR